MAVVENDMFICGSNKSQETVCDGRNITIRLALSPTRPLPTLIEREKNNHLAGKKRGRKLEADCPLESELLHGRPSPIREQKTK